MTFGCPNPRPAEGLGGRTPPGPRPPRSGQERVKGAKMAGLFCSAPASRGGCPLAPGPRSRFHRPLWLPARLEPPPLLQPGASRTFQTRARRGAAAARPARRSFGAAAGSRGVCGAPRAGDDAAGRHPAPVLASRAHRGLSRRPAARRRGGPMGVPTLPSSGQRAERHTRRPSELPQPTPRWAQTPVGQGFLDGSQT